MTLTLEREPATAREQPEATPPAAEPQEPEPEERRPRWRRWAALLAVMSLGAAVVFVVTADTQGPSEKTTVELTPVAPRAKAVAPAKSQVPTSSEAPGPARAADPEVDGCVRPVPWVPLPCKEKTP